MALGVARVGPQPDFTGNCAAEKCNLPLAEKVYRTVCDHYFHANCLKKAYEIDPLCCMCKKDLSKTDDITFEPVDYEGDENCAICQESMKQTAQRLNQNIIVASDGRCFHEGCFEGREEDIGVRIGAQEIVEDPTFKMWEQGGKRRLDEPGEPIQGDDDLAAKLQLADLQRLQAGGVLPIGGGYVPGINNDFELLMACIAAAICVLSVIAFTLNSFVNFTDPLLHIASIPFYLLAIASLCKSISENCEIAPN